MVRLKRVYEKPTKADGLRVLVDRLWPRGVSKDTAKVDVWLREVAPSDALRKWFAHDPRKWAGFRKKYHTELKRKAGLLRTLKTLEQQHGVITLLFAASDTARNNAVVVTEFLKHRS